MFKEKLMALLSGSIASCGSFEDYVYDARAAAGGEGKKADEAEKKARTEFRGVEILDHSDEFTKLGDCYTKPVEKSAELFRVIANGIADMKGGNDGSTEAGFVRDFGWKKTDLVPMSKTALQAFDKKLNAQHNVWNPGTYNSMITNREILQLRFRLHAAEVALAIKLGADPEKLD